MKHPPTSLFIGVLTSFLFLHSSRADIVIYNPGIEGSLSSWVHSSSGVAYNTTDMHSGSGCVQLTGSTSAHPSFLQTIHGLQANTAYNLEVYGKLGTAPSATFTVSGYGGNTTSSAVTSTNYQRIELPFTTGASSTSVTISFGVGTGNAYADDFAVIPAQPVPASDPSNTAGWTLNANLSDEFSGATLDPSKWRPYSSLFSAGSFPWKSFSNNASVSGGLLHLQTTNCNLLPNGDFDTGDFTSWTTNGTCAIGQYTSGEAVEWTYGAKLTGAANLRQLITGLTPNTQYTLAGQFKIGSGGTGVTISADTYGGSPVSSTLYSTDADAKSGSNYVYVTRSLTFTTGATSTSAIITVTNSGAVGTVYADETTLVVTSLGLPAGRSFQTGTIEGLTKPQYGYYEARMKAAPGPNVSSFWFWNYPNSGTNEVHVETDVCELVGAPLHDPPGYTNYQYRMPITTHYFPKAGGNYVNNTRPMVNADVSADFHTYGMDWESDAITFYFDGVQQARFAQVQPPAVVTANGQTQILWLDFLTFDTEIYTVYGSPSGTTDFQIDYIRSWTK